MPRTRYPSQVETQRVYVVLGAGRLLQDVGTGAAVQSDDPGETVYLRSLRHIDVSKIKKGDTRRLKGIETDEFDDCLLYTSPSPRD